MLVKHELPRQMHIIYKGHTFIGFSCLRVHPSVLFPMYLETASRSRGLVAAAKPPVGEITSASPSSDDYDSPSDLDIPDPFAFFDEVFPKKIE